MDNTHEFLDRFEAAQKATTIFVEGLGISAADEAALKGLISSQVTRGMRLANAVGHKAGLEYAKLEFSLEPENSTENEAF